MEKVNLADIRVDHLTESTLPLSEADLLCSDWDGAAINKAQKSLVLAHITRSSEHPGFIHYRVWSAATSFDLRSIKPVNPMIVGAAVDHMLSDIGMTAGGLKWKQVSGEDAWQPESKPEKSGSSVYFIQPVDGGLVKIGVSNSPESRLSNLQCGSPVELRIVKTIPDVPRSLERKLHEKFAQHRRRGEWFDPIVLSLPVSA